LFLACGYNIVLSISPHSALLHFQFKHVFFICFIYLSILLKGNYVGGKEVSVTRSVPLSGITFVFSMHSMSNAHVLKWKENTAVQVVVWSVINQVIMSSANFMKCRRQVNSGRQNVFSS
jgi:hypothetical protein